MIKLKKIKYWLQLADGIWSVPLAFCMFWFAGILLTSLFGYGTGTYDPGFIQPLFLASAVVIGATNMTVWGIYFTFRGLYRYLYGQKKPDGNRVNYSKMDWIKLTVWQRYVIAFTVFFLFFFAILLVFLKLV
jgi:hypothetical protein